MGFINNLRELSETSERKVVLELVETAFASIQPEEVFKSNIHLHGSILTIGHKDFDLDKYERVFLLGFGKGSAGNSKLLERLILNRLTEGFVIDTQEPEDKFKKIEFTKGTHPLPSEVNYEFTKNAIKKLSNLSENDLVLVVICGGGSAMLVHPHSISLDQKINVGKALLKSGATISEMNAVRKHLSDVKGGGLADILYPATVATLIYSDVPGNDLSVIASGPTVHDPTKVEDSLRIIKKYNLEKELNLPKDAFVENPQDKKYFEKVHNIIVLSNETALLAMQKKAKKLGWTAKILSDRFESEAKAAGYKLITATHHRSILLVGGETTVHVTKKGGHGGRNQELVLAALKHVGRDATICSFDSDGWDNSENAGAIGDYKTIDKCKNLGIDPEKYLEDNSSLDFFNKIRDAIVTGRLPSNVSDLMIVLKK
jgi:glycerate-2-kinase